MQEKAKIEKRTVCKAIPFTFNPTTSAFNQSDVSWRAYPERPLKYKTSTISLEESTTYLPGKYALSKQHSYDDGMNLKKSRNNLIKQMT